jgi:hypothetical protein
VRAVTDMLVGVVEGVKKVGGSALPRSARTATAVLNPQSAGAQSQKKPKRSLGASTRTRSRQ